jgi:hypothetical protein
VAPDNVNRAWQAFVRCRDAGSIFSVRCRYDTVYDDFTSGQRAWMISVTGQMISADFHGPKGRKFIRKGASDVVVVDQEYHGFMSTSLHGTTLCGNPGPPSGAGSTRRLGGAKGSAGPPKRCMAQRGHLISRTRRQRTSQAIDRVCGRHIRPSVCGGARPSVRLLVSGWFAPARCSCASRGADTSPAAELCRPSRRDPVISGASGQRRLIIASARSFRWWANRIPSQSESARRLAGAPLDRDETFLTPFPLRRRNLRPLHQPSPETGASVMAARYVDIPITGIAGLVALSTRICIVTPFHSCK